MRVLMFVTTDITHDARVMREATALSQAGHDVWILGIRRDGTEPFTEVAAGARMQRLDLWHMRLVRWLKARRGLKPSQGMFASSIRPTAGQSRSDWRDWLIEALHQVEFLVDILTVWVTLGLAALRQKADIYHAHDVNTLLPALFVGRWRNKPVIYDAHEYWHNVRRDQIVRHTVIRLIERIGIRRCAHVFTVNRSIAERMAMHYRISMPTVLMNVPMEVSSQPPPPLCDDRPVELLYLGGFFAHRGLEILIAAMALVKTPVHLTMRGYGEMELSLKEQVELLGHQTKVAFKPPVRINQVVQSATCCHIGILPFERRSEFYFALPNKLFEYMAAGLAILTNNLPEIAAIVEEHDLGIVYETENPTILAQVIDQLASDRTYLGKCRQRAWHVYHERYAWEQHQHVLLDVYTDLT